MCLRRTPSWPMMKRWGVWGKHYPQTQTRNPPHRGTGGFFTSGLKGGPVDRRRGVESASRRMVWEPARRPYRRAYAAPARPTEEIRGFKSLAPGVECSLWIWTGIWNFLVVRCQTPD